MKNSDQLSITVTAFDQWRETRTNRGERTPLALRQQAASLCTRYPSSKITTALKISGAQLKQWSKTHAPNNDYPDFIHLPSTPTTETLNLNLTFANGATFALNGAVSSTLITTIIQVINT